MKVPNIYICCSRGPFGRFYLYNHSDRSFWTGKEWSTKHREALLHLSMQEAAETFAEVQQQYFSDKKVVENFETSIQIEVRSDSGVDVEKLKEWLRSAVVLNIRYAECESGPEGTLVQLRFQADDIKRDEP